MTYIVTTRDGNAQLYATTDAWITLSLDSAGHFSRERAKAVAAELQAADPPGQTRWHIRPAPNRDEDRLMTAQRFAHDHPELVDDHSDADPGL